MRNYGYALKKIEAKFGTMPILAIGARGARGVFLKWRDSMKATPRKADHDWTVLARVLSFAKDRQRIDVNPCERGGRLYEADRTDCLWTEADGKLLSVASVEVRAVVLFALWTGQRQGDLLRLPWSAFDGRRIRLRQSKKRAPRRRARYRGAWRRHRLAAEGIASDPDFERGPPWTSDGFRTSFGRACNRAMIEGLTFHDLRGTAVTRLALAGCTTLEIASITGHSERDVAQMLEKHYLGDRAKLVEAAIIKLEARTKV